MADPLPTVLEAIVFVRSAIAIVIEAVADVLRRHDRTDALRPEAVRPATLESGLAFADAAGRALQGVTLLLLTIDTRTTLINLKITVVVETVADLLAHLTVTAAAVSAANPCAAIATPVRLDDSTRGTATNQYAQEVRQREFA